MSLVRGPAVKLLWRDARSGELNLLIASLILAVATVTCINLFTDRIQRSIAAQASTLLAADAQVRGPRPVPEQWRALAREAGLQTADIISFQAMVFAGEQMQLTAVKAVDDAYPLRGDLGIADVPYGPERVVTDGPEPGRIWLASRLFAALDIEPGDKVAVGNKSFTVDAALLREPDSGGSLFGGGARVMINAADVPATGAVQVGSRVTYRWLLAGPTAAVTALGKQLEPELSPHYRWLTPGDGNRGIGDAMERSERFLLLAGSLGVVLAGAALALAARRYGARQRSAVALLKTLGMVPRDVLRLYLANIAILGLVTTALGLLLGWLLHHLIVLLLGDLLPETLVAAGATAFFAGAGVGLLALLAFAAPPLLALRNVPPVSVLRTAPSGVSGFWHGSIGVLAVVGLIYAYSRSLELTLYISAGGVAAILGVWLLAAALVRLSLLIARRLRKGYRLGFANLFRHRRYNSAQIMLFSILLLLMFVLYTLRTSMLEEWRSQLPEKAPNHFAFNIFSSEKEAIQKLLAEHKVETSPFYPMVRGRLTAVNGEDAQERARAMGGEPEDDRELNFTWTRELAEDNEILQGQWWQKEPEPGQLRVSVEESYAEDYRIGVGDIITVSISGTSREAEVVSIRSVEWDSMRPNFFLIFNQPLVDSAAVNWLTSFYLPPERKDFVNTLIRRYPTMSLLELDQMISQIQSIIDQVSKALDFILVLTVGAGFLVLVASVQATLDIRLHESALLRALGASRKLVLTSLAVEFAAIGCLAGLMAALGSEITLFFLTRTFEMEYHLHGHLWLLAPATGIVLVGMVGLLSTTSVVRVAPMSILRRA